MTPTPTMVHQLKLHWQSCLLLFLLAWMLGIAGYRGATNPESGITGIDFKIYYEAAQWLNDGLPLYPPPEKTSYMYTPLVAVAIKPLARMPYETALRIWSVMNVVALFSAVGIFAAAARIVWHDALRLGIMLLILFRYWPTVGNLGLGQVNCLLLVLLAGIFFAETRGRFYTIGVLIAAAAMIKLWMIGFGLYLVVRRAWGAAVWCGAVFAVFLAASFAAIGFHEWTGFVTKIASPSSSVMPSIVSQSIPGFARLRFSENPLMDPFTTSHIAHSAFVGLGCLAIGLALAWLFFAGAPRSPQEARVRTGFTMLSVLLLLPICHLEYFILAVPLLWTFLAAPSGDRVPPATIIAALVLYVVFTRPIPVSAPDVARISHLPNSLIVSTPFFAAVALWTLALLEIGRLRRKPATEQTAPLPTGMASIA